VGIFAMLVAAGIGFPIPEELPIVTAGGLAGYAASPQHAQRPVPPEFLATQAVAPPAGFPGGLPWGGLALSTRRSRDVAPTPDSRPISIHWWILLPVCILGVVISDGLLYGIGRMWGTRLLRVRWMQRLLPWSGWIGSSAISRSTAC